MLKADESTGDLTWSSSLPVLFAKDATKESTEAASEGAAWPSEDSPKDSYELVGATAGSPARAFNHIEHSHVLPSS
jgi:hypothetical protein